MSEERFAAAVAAQLLAAASARHELLTSIVETARSIFLAEASSIALLDEQAEELIFEAVAGRGDTDLVGRRFPLAEGIAGSVIQTGEPLILDDVSRDPRFARDVAEDTGYVPNRLMVAPLIHGESILGTLSVLDRGETGRSSLQEMGLLSQFARQAAMALELTAAAGRARALVDEGGDEIAAVARLAEHLDALEGERREAGLRLVEALEALLSAES
jgi:GAF domain-containing protein